MSLCQQLSTIQSDIEKLHDAFKNLEKLEDEDISQLIEDCQSFICDNDCEGGLQPETRANLVLLQQQLKKKLQEGSKKHRELHAPLSKMGKLIDRSFVTELPSALSGGQLDGDSEKLEQLNSAICEHLVREGSLEVAQELIAEAKLDYKVSHLNAYTTLNRVVESLAKRQLEPALAWLDEHREALTNDETRRYLEFLIRRLQLIQLILQDGVGPEKILAQARHLASYSPACDEEIRRVMGSLAFIRRNLQRSPYKDLFEARLYHELSQLLVSEANKMLGFAKELPLSVAVSAGCLALPPLLNIQTVMNQRNLSTAIKTELPIDLDLGEEYRYHSVFACPILRAQTSESNPPVRLVCGHAISRDAVAKLANNSAKFKCPYCPVEMDPLHVMEIHF